MKGSYKSYTTESSRAKFQSIIDLVRKDVLCTLIREKITCTGETIPSDCDIFRLRKKIIVDDKFLYSLKHSRLTIEISDL